MKPRMVPAVATAVGFLLGASALEIAAQGPAPGRSTVGPGSPPIDAIKRLEKVATGDPEPSSRARAIRELLRQGDQPEARESALRGLASIGLLEEPAPELADAWLEFVGDARQRRDPSAAIRLTRGSDVGKGVLGYGILLRIEGEAGSSTAAQLDARKAIERAWERPETTSRLLRAIGLAKVGGYAPRVTPLLGVNRAEVRRAADFAARRLGLAPKSPEPSSSTGPTIAAIPYERVLAFVLREKGDAALGARFFEKQGCAACHSVARGQPIKGPYLGDIATRSSRSELVESLLKPSARIARGFETQKVALASGLVFEGFVVRESGDELELRNSAGDATVVARKDIEERVSSQLSVMPQGLLDPLTPADLASLLAYLESLKGR